MSLKDLLPEGTFEEISAEAAAKATSLNKTDITKGDPEGTANPQSSVLWVRCPSCGRKTPYTKDNPFRPFCSERCRLLDLGSWASDERIIAGNPITADEDADLLNDPHLPRH